MTAGRSRDSHLRLITRQRIRARLPQCATRHKLGIRKCKARAGRQISTLFARAALFERSSGNAADQARVYSSVRSAWTKRSLAAMPRTQWPLGTRFRGRKLAGLGQTFVSIRHAPFWQVDAARPEMAQADLQ